MNFILDDSVEEKKAEDDELYYSNSIDNRKSKKYIFLTQI